MSGLWVIYLIMGMNNMTTQERQECIKLMGATTRAFVMYRATNDVNTLENDLEEIIGRLNELLYGGTYDSL